MTFSSARSGQVSLVTRSAGAAETGYRDTLGSLTCSRVQAAERPYLSAVSRGEHVRRSRRL